MWRFKIVPRPTLTLLVLAHLAVTQETTGSDNLLIQSRWIQFDVINGRVTAHRAQYPQNKTATAHDEQAGVCESLSVSAESSQPSVSYERMDRQQYVRVEVVDGDQVEIRREVRSPANEATIRFSQPCDGKMELVVESGPSLERHAASSLWHLLLAQPDVCRRHLIPILEVLRPNWRLMETANHLEEALCHDACAASTIPQSDVPRLIAQLDSHEFQQRQAADRRLRDLGQTAYASLHEWDLSLLSKEQRLRIRWILAALKVQNGDTPERLTVQLVNDPAIWLVLLTNSDASKRRHAVSQLGRILEQSVDFDPLGSLAERMETIERLSIQLGVDCPTRCLNPTTSRREASLSERTPIDPHPSSRIR